MQLTVLVHKTLPCSWLTQILLFLILLFSDLYCFFSIYCYFLLVSSASLQMFLRLLSVKWNFLPGDTLIRYFSGAQSTHIPWWFSDRLWLENFSLFFTHRTPISITSHWNSAKPVAKNNTPRGQANRAEMWPQARLEARASNSMNAFHTGHYW